MHTLMTRIILRKGKNKLNQVFLCSETESGFFPLMVKPIYN